MDNTGPYAKYDELIVELYLAGLAVVSKVADMVLSNKVTDAGGDIFEYDAGAPAVGDVVNQLGKSATVIELLTTPNRVRVDETDTESDLANGAAMFLRSISVPRFRGEALIEQFSDFIDEQTGQFFNKRAADVALEGNNTDTMWLPVPIIEITSLILNNAEPALTEGEDEDYVAFKGRARPQDDRRNPRIKLGIRANDSIFSGPRHNRFIKRTLTHIVGYFGFLEPDGSTPLLIKKAVIILVAKEINTPSTSSSATLGALKRVKVDLHEKEFFKLGDSGVATPPANMSGVPEVDQIIAKFKTPIRMGGSIQILSDLNRGV